MRNVTPVFSRFWLLLLKPGYCNKAERGCQAAQGVETGQALGCTCEVLIALRPSHTARKIACVHVRGPLLRRCAVGECKERRGVASKLPSAGHLTSRLQQGTQPGKLVACGQRSVAKRMRGPHVPCLLLHAAVASTHAANGTGLV